MDLTDEQWEVLEPLIPDPPQREDSRGRPWRDPRDVLNGILWILRTGAPWKDLPERYPPYQTCHRRFQRWIEEGVRACSAAGAHTAKLAMRGFSFSSIRARLPRASLTAPSRAPSTFGRASSSSL